MHRYLSTCVQFGTWVAVQTPWWEQWLRKRRQTIRRESWALKRNCQEWGRVKEVGLKRAQVQLPKGAAVLEAAGGCYWPLSLPVCWNWEGSFNNPIISSPPNTTVGPHSEVLRQEGRVIPLPARERRSLSDQTQSSKEVSMEGLWAVGIMNKEDCRDRSGETSFFSPQSLGRLCVLPWGPLVGGAWRTLWDIGKCPKRFLEVLRRDPMEMKGLPIQQQVGKQN